MPLQYGREVSLLRTKARYNGLEDSMVGMGVGIWVGVVACRGHLLILV